MSEHIYDDKGDITKKPAKETPGPEAENAAITRDNAAKLSADSVARLQQTVGNTTVQRFLAQRSGSGPSEIDEETAASINNSRGSGQALDGTMAQRAGQTMGRDFSDVTVHNDSDADQLSHQLGAKAFTTGKDIYFREGAYDPGSSAGQHLIAHELTHVAQQGSAAPVQAKMTVNDPNDKYEAEADSVADVVMNQPAEEEEWVSAQEEEEEEMVQAQDEEEELQMQEVPEEEEELQMQEMPEDEEELQM